MTVFAVAKCRSCGYEMRLKYADALHTYKRSECPCARSSIGIFDGLIACHGDAVGAEFVDEASQ